MEELIIRSQQKVQRIPLDFTRYLLPQVRPGKRLTGIKGARGSGKTTLLLQYMALNLPRNGSALYVSMDDLFFTDKTLLGLAEEFSLSGGKFLLVDEVHKYPGWSRELKLIYDNLPDLQVIFTSSSILEIYQGESDLSRRVVSYDLRELSLREFIELSIGVKTDVFTLDDILKHHVEIAGNLLKLFKPVKIFKDYTKFGAYPYFREDIETYHQSLLNTVNLIIDVDLHAAVELQYDMLTKIKKLLRMIAVSVPFTPNISRLSEITGISRPSLLKALNQLERARMLWQLTKPGSGTGILTKPEKLYLNNTNLLYVLAQENWVTGTIRETFLVNQLTGEGRLNLAEKGDFILNESITFEVGGPSKKQRQIRNIPESYIVKDDIEVGVKNIIPLWLFGFLY
jgi:predicted AAA+ superfamily ATPase